jgi:hypothetical protein
MGIPFSSDELSKLFLLERRNREFLNDHARWTSQERRSAYRLAIAFVICLCIALVLLANHRSSVQLLRSGWKSNALVLSKRIDTDTGSHYISYCFQTQRPAEFTKVENHLWSSPAEWFASSRQ